VLTKNILHPKIVFFSGSVILKGEQKMLNIAEVLRKCQFTRMLAYINVKQTNKQTVIYVKKKQTTV